MILQNQLLSVQQDRLLYVGESQCTGCNIYYFDADTLQPKSSFLKNGSGITNETRDIFHIGDSVFWANYCLSDTDAEKTIGRYGEWSHGSVNYASAELVSTFEGLFLTDTCECILNYADEEFYYEYILISKSNNIFFRSKDYDRNMIIGINFN